MLVKDSVYVKGKVYKTVGGLPATVLYVNVKRDLVYVVHNRYKPDEVVLVHSLDGVVKTADDVELRNALKDDVLEQVSKFFSTDFIAKTSLTKEFYNG